MVGVGVEDFFEGNCLLLIVGLVKRNVVYLGKWCFCLCLFVGKWVLVSVEMCLGG